ncbi:MAG: DUF5665 domain-containing protein [Candidatus Curtissbacteria bacterium]|nr:DUF5665 domain-containing protein [Candidatus Curtissbacteria bacterium]
MASKKTSVQLERELAKEIKSLTKEVHKLKDLEFIQILKHPFKLMWLSLLKGLMVGFGSVLGASVLVAFFVYLVAQISLVPILGDFVKDIMSQINIPQTQDQSENNNIDFIDK